MIQFARENVDCGKEQKARDAAYNRAADLVGADTLKKYPLDEMEVLKKYSVAEVDYCIKGGDPRGVFQRFVFEDDDDRAPLVPVAYCSSRSVPFSSKTSAAIQKLELSNDAYQKKFERILRDYRALIEGSRYFEDVLEVWPGVEALAGEICKQPTAVSVLSEDALARIRNTNISEAA